MNPVPEALDQFDKPASITSFKPADHKGRLVLIWPHNVKQQQNDEGKMEDVTEVDVVVLDADGGPVRYDSVNMRQKYLQARVRRNVGTGRANLGRITQRPPNNPKNSPGWDLDDPTEADVTMARAYMRSPSARSATTFTPASFGTPGYGGVAGLSSDEPPF